MMVNERWKYRCPTTVREFDQGAGPKISHYQIDEWGDATILAHPYRILVFQNLDNATTVYIIGNDPNSDSYYKYVATVPPFEITSEERLIKKLNNLLAFI
jgi:hypothetical protein